MTIGTSIFLVRFQSTLPVWGATRDQLRSAGYPAFQSTLPVWGATVRLASGRVLQGFQSTLPVWGATRVAGRRPAGPRFQSTLPVWGATFFCTFSSAQSTFQSTLPVWGATPAPWVDNPKNVISIHAPRVGSDAAPLRRPSATSISIHAPRVGSDGVLADALNWAGIFQSTLPVWGATGERRNAGGCGNDFNPRSPCGERRQDVLHLPPNQISIHAPRVGSDHIREAAARPGRIFQSTLPVWGATICKEGACPIWTFQSTLPVWGATVSRSCNGETAHYFNPRSPCGERHQLKAQFWITEQFQSTLPVWGATLGALVSSQVQQEFQSTLPVWGATVHIERNDLTSVISIHAPRVGSDRIIVNTKS